MCRTGRTERSGHTEKPPARVRVWVRSHRTASNPFRRSVQFHLSEVNVSSGWIPFGFGPRKAPSDRDTDYASADLVHEIVVAVPAPGLPTPCPHPGVKPYRERPLPPWCRSRAPSPLGARLKAMAAGGRKRPSGALQAAEVGSIVRGDERSTWAGQEGEGE